MRENEATLLEAMKPMNNMNENDLWEILGDLEQEEFEQILIQLFMKYEALRKADPADNEAKQFFSYLSAIVNHVQSCNVNRR